MCHFPSIVHMELNREKGFTDIVESIRNHSCYQCFLYQGNVYTQSDVGQMRLHFTARGVSVSLTQRQTQFLTFSFVYVHKGSLVGIGGGGGV